MSNQPSAPPDLPEPERACLTLAWEAMLAGTNPIGAVVVDGSGVIVATGRNAVYGPADPGLLSASRLAHAEVNALLRLPVDERHGGLRLVTSLEPCQMCAGAVRMATVGALTYLGADPVHGTAWALAHERYVGYRPVAVAGPRTDAYGQLASALSLAFVQARRPEAEFVTTFRDRRPDLAAATDALFAVGLTDITAAGMPWDRARPLLMAAIEPGAAPTAGPTRLA